MSFAADAFLARSDGTVWRYRDGKQITPGGQPSKLPMLLGAAQRDYDAFQTQVGQMSVRRSYDNNMPSTFAGSAASGDPARGCASMWSWSDTSQVSAVASGSLNSKLLGFFNSIPAGHRVWAIFWHEVDLHYRTFATYQSAYAQIRAQLEASTADTSLVKVGGLLTSSGFRNGDGNNYFDSSHMFVGVDAYEFWRPQGSPDDPKTGSLSQHRTISYLIGDGVNGGANDTATRLGLPLIFGEYGIHPFPPTDPDYATGSRPLRLQQAVDYLDNNANPVEAFAYFHSDAGGSGPWWLNCYPNWTTPSDQSNADPDSVSAWQGLLATHQTYSGA